MSNPEASRTIAEHFSVFEEARILGIGTLMTLADALDSLQRQDGVGRYKGKDLSRLQNLQPHATPEMITSLRAEQRNHKKLLDLKNNPTFEDAAYDAITPEMVEAERGQMTEVLSQKHDKRVTASKRGWNTRRKNEEEKARAAAQREIKERVSKAMSHELVVSNLRAVRCLNDSIEVSLQVPEQFNELDPGTFSGAQVFVYDAAKPESAPIRFQHTQLSDVMGSSRDLKVVIPASAQVSDRLEVVVDVRRNPSQNQYRRSFMVDVVYSGAVGKEAAAEAPGKSHIHGAVEIFNGSASSTKLQQNGKNSGKEVGQVRRTKNRRTIVDSARPLNNGYNHGVIYHRTQHLGSRG